MGEGCFDSHLLEQWQGCDNVKASVERAEAVAVEREGGEALEACEWRQARDAVRRRVQPLEPRARCERLERR